MVNSQGSEQVAYLVASGDLRESANQAGWPAQVELEEILARVLREHGWTLQRAHEIDSERQHGFISSQRMGMDIFRNIPSDAPVIVAEAIWQYSHHILGGLREHQGPILTVANFAPAWSGLVGLLNLNAGLTKMGKRYSTAWTIDGTDAWFLDVMAEWLRVGNIEHDETHVHSNVKLPEVPAVELGRGLARELKERKSIIGIFDEGCMGMYNGIIDDEILNASGIYKERLSQSALWAEMQTVPDAEASKVQEWLESMGMKFRLGSDDATELTMEQLLWQHKMYIAALRIADDFGVDAIGIQYQQGLKDICPASDLVEGLLNNAQRPPVRSRDGSRVLWEGQPLPHFNEVDQGAAVDALVTNQVWKALGLDPATTLHDIRWGEDFEGQYVWTFEISGSVPASHLPDGYASAEGWRQSPIFFPAGGSTLNGISKPGDVVWSRVYVADGRLHADIGRADAIELPEAEAQRRKEITNPEWPVMFAVLHGVTRNQFMARHKANHIQVAYASSPELADQALYAKAAMFEEMGIEVHFCGDVTGV